MKKTVSIIRALVFALAFAAIAFAEDSAEAPAPFVRFTDEDKNVEFEWTGSYYPISYDYNTGGMEGAFILFSVKGDLALHDLPPRKDLKKAEGTDSVYVVCNGKGGTVTAELYSADRELITTDTINVSVPLGKRILYPFVTVGSNIVGLTITGGLLNIFVGIPLLMAFFSAPFTLLFGALGLS